MSGNESYLLHLFNGCSAGIDHCSGTGIATKYPMYLFEIKTRKRSGRRILGK
jgi:hypothetical protein